MSFLILATGNPHLSFYFLWVPVASFAAGIVVQFSWLTDGVILTEKRCIRRHDTKLDRIHSQLRLCPCIYGVRTLECVRQTCLQTLKLFSFLWEIAFVFMLHNQTAAHACVNVCVSLIDCGKESERQQSDATGRVTIDFLVVLIKWNRINCFGQIFSDFNVIQVRLF